MIDEFPCVTYFACFVFLLTGKERAFCEDGSVLTFTSFCSHTYAVCEGQQVHIKDEHYHIIHFLEQMKKPQQTHNSPQFGIEEGEERRRKLLPALNFWPFPEMLKVSGKQLIFTDRDLTKAER